MRKVIFGGANSLDNYFARPDGGLDWLLWGDEAAAFMKDYWKTFDTMVMGRITYEASLQHGGGAYPGMDAYICSTTMTPGRMDNGAIVVSDGIQLVSELKERKGRDVCIMGGGILARSLFEADLIDEIGFNIHPVILGGGIPLYYELSKQIDLELLECQAWKNGCVLVRYRVKKLSH